MRDEVEEFLRRAAARRAQAEAKRREQQQQASQPGPPPVQRQPLVQRPASIAQSLPQVEPLVEIIEAEEADTSSRFSSSVARHLSGTTEIARHASSLGAEVDQADDKLQARLSKTFDHQIGQLKDTTTAAPVKQAMQSSETLLASMNLTRLLSNAQSIRNAIILSEVLNRPEHRWD